MIISGEKNPVIGVEYKYWINNGINTIDINSQKSDYYCWKIYLKQKNGQWKDVTRNGGKIGKEVNYSFTKVGLEYRLDVFKVRYNAIINNIENTSFLNSFYLIPIEKGSKPKIVKAVLYNKGAKNVNIVPLTGKLTVKVNSVGLFNKVLKIHVWRENSSKEENAKTVKDITVDAKGIAITEFNVIDLFDSLALVGLMTHIIKEAKLYVTISYENLSLTNKEPVVYTNETSVLQKTENDGKTLASYKETPTPEKTKETKCFCNRDFEESDVKQLVNYIKGRETIWEGYKIAPCNIDDKSFSTLTKELNATFKKYKINHCAQKLHFLTQVCHETDNFTLSEETKSSHASSQSNYKGRGILQLTGVRKEGETYYDLPGPYENYANYAGIKAVKNPQIIAEEVKYAVDSGGWMFDVFKTMPKAPSDAVDRWGSETAGKSLNELALYGDKYLELISALLNGRPNPKAMPNGWEKRKMNYDLLKTGFFNYDFYHSTKQKQKTEATDDIVTYHIYANGTIEKHIPKTIKNGYEDKYKYVYHDKDDNKYTICILVWHNTEKKETGKNQGKVMPTHSKIIYDEKVSEGQTSRRVKYENGNVAEYGYNKKKNFWNLYKSLGDKIELVKMPDSLNYNYSGIIVKYSFSNTKRRYTSPGAMAGFIGALAENGFTEVKTTGSCSKEGTCFPSVAHVNGKSIDTLYMNRSNQTKFIKAMNKFYFEDQITGNDGTHTYDDTSNKSDHNDHLHSGFKESKIKVIYEK